MGHDQDDEDLKEGLDSGETDVPHVELGDKGCKLDFGDDPAKYLDPGYNPSM